MTEYVRAHFGRVVVDVDLRRSRSRHLQRLVTSPARLRNCRSLVIAHRVLLSEGCNTTRVRRNWYSIKVEKGMAYNRRVGNRVRVVFACGRARDGGVEKKRQWRVAERNRGRSE